MRPHDSTPMSLLRIAIRAVPAVKYALGLAGIISAAAVVRALFDSIAAALVAASGMLFLMVILVLFAAASKLGPKVLHLPALVLTWAILVLFVGSACLAVFAAFFDWPKTFPALLEDVVRKDTGVLLGLTVPVLVTVEDEVTGDVVVNAIVYIDLRGREVCPQQPSQKVSPIRCALAEGDYLIVVNYKGQTRSQLLRVTRPETRATVRIPI